jgi:hypothetical protein
MSSKRSLNNIKENILENFLSVQKCHFEDILVDWARIWHSNMSQLYEIV